MYFHGLLSEHLVPEGKTRQRWVWQKIQGHERNEPLDCRNYALAAFETLPVNLDAIDRRIKIAQGKAVPSDERPKQQPPKRRGPVKPKDTGYDDW